MSKEYRLKDLFKSRPGEWIPLPEILNLNIAQYGRVIHGLRHKDLMNIENKKEYIDGETHSWFRYNEFVREENGQMVMV